MHASVCGAAVEIRPFLCLVPNPIGIGDTVWWAV